MSELKESWESWDDDTKRGIGISLILVIILIFAAYLVGQMSAVC